MRVPHGWLAELVPGLPDPATTADLLAGLGLGVEVVEEVAGAPAGVVVAEVLEVAAIDGADVVRRAVVDDGAGRRVVACGAPNVTVGMRAAYAPPGTLLPGFDGPLEVRDVAGVRSDGMLCSPRELGLFEHAGGLLALGHDAPIGAQLEELWPGDVVLELELTPNRADAFSLLGVARDLAAKLAVELRHPADGLAGAAGDPSVDDGLTVRVDDADRCPWFTLRRIDDVRVGPAPVALQRRLALLGVRPRNVVVDVTNLVTFELGQPSHAYDLRALHGGVLEVRRARADESLVTLQDEQLTLEADDLVIATPDGAGGSRAIGLAGVIGGREDSVLESTTSVALEVAWFEPTGVRRTGRRHKQITDARTRFERGVDPALAELASARAVALLEAAGAGRAHPGLSVAGAAAPARPKVAYRPERVEFLMGFDVPRDEQRRILERLGCSVEGADEGTWTVHPPSWRVDLTIEEDVVEEVARLYGFEHIGSSVPHLDVAPSAGDPTHRLLRERLVGAGMLETIGYAFVSDDDLARARAPAAVVRLAEPQSDARAVLRTALLPGLLAAARTNRDVPSLALFEVGRVFVEPEEERVGLLWRGARVRSGWRADGAIDPFVAKGVLESLAEGLGVALELRPAPVAYLHPGVSARVVWAGDDVGTFGRLHPEVARDWGCGDVLVAELRLPLAMAAPVVREVPRQPFAERDLAVVVPADVTYATLHGLCATAAGDRLAELFPFDVYEGGQVGEGRKSLALRFRFRHPERALTDVEVDARMKAVMSAVDAAGYAIRT
ncbi:MAG: phenylalanine--tRNA ligase subunit beta [Trueperaceae bacterium]